MVLGLVSAIARPDTLSPRPVGRTGAATSRTMNAVQRPNGPGVWQKIEMKRYKEKSQLPRRLNLPHARRGIPRPDFAESRASGRVCWIDRERCREGCIRV